MCYIWLMLEVWLAGLQINRSASKTSQCHRVLELAPATGTLGHFQFSSWLWMMEKKLLKLSWKKNKLSEQAQHILHKWQTDRQTDRHRQIERWIHHAKHTYIQQYSIYEHFDRGSLTGDKCTTTVQCSLLMSVVWRWWRCSCHGSYRPHGTRCRYHFHHHPVWVPGKSHTHKPVCLLICVSFHRNLKLPWCLYVSTIVWVSVHSVVCQCVFGCVHSCMWFACYCNVLSVPRRGGYVCFGLGACKLCRGAINVKLASICHCCKWTTAAFFYLNMFLGFCPYFRLQRVSKQRQWETRCDKYPSPELRKFETQDDSSHLCTVFFNFPGSE